MKSMSFEEKYLAKIDTLIPRPFIALEVLEIAQDEDSSVSDLTKKIEQDPNLTINVLRMANSSYYGFMKQISSVSDVVVRLGRDTIKILAITSASAGLLKSPLDVYGFEPQDLWHHSYASAILAEFIASHAGYDSKFSIFTAALLHDIGKVLLNKPLQQAMAEKKITSIHVPVIELEQTLLHTDHARLGMALLIKWGLPDEIITPIGFHHITEGENAGLMNTKIVSLANFMVKKIETANIVEDGSTDIKDILSQSEIDRNIPNFQENFDIIIEEFFKSYHEASLTI